MKNTSKSVVNKKKKLQTTLGKAPELQKEDSDDEVDVSHVGRAIETSVHGLQQVVSLLKNATAEVTVMIFLFFILNMFGYIKTLSYADMIGKKSNSTLNYVVILFMKKKQKVEN